MDWAKTGVAANIAKSDDDAKRRDVMDMGFPETRERTRQGFLARSKKAQTKRGGARGDCGVKRAAMAVAVVRSMEAVKAWKAGSANCGSSGTEARCGAA